MSVTRSCSTGQSAGTGAIPRRARPEKLPEPEDVIFVTGFGPFGTHTVNASWQAVCRLHESDLARQLGVQLVIEEVPVKYEYVLREIPKRWRELRPRLVVHVGVSSQTMSLQLERRSHNGPYERCDVMQAKPPEHCCVPALPAAQELSTRLDLELCCKVVAGSCATMDAETSEDAGRYLCDFIYHTSLSQDPARAVFVHVPPLGMPYTANQMAEALKVVICELYRQVKAVDQPPKQPRQPQKQPFEPSQPLDLCTHDRRCEGDVGRSPLPVRHQRAADGCPPESRW